MYWICSRIASYSCSDPSGMAYRGSGSLPVFILFVVIDFCPPPEMYLAVLVKPVDMVEIYSSYVYT
jgi:hypothetical protein